MTDFEEFLTNSKKPLANFELLVDFEPLIDFKEPLAEFIQNEEFVNIIYSNTKELSHILLLRSQKG